MGETLTVVGNRLTAANASVDELETDYLVVGAGAMAMAFIDVVLKKDRKATFVVVDRHASPGGHWNDAYSFVTLHQPAEFYGLVSTHLGDGGADLCSLPAIVAYYVAAMKRFVATGRVTFLSMSKYEGNGMVSSILNPDRQTHVTVRRRLIDATYLEAKVPSVVKPRYEVADDVELIPPNALSRLRKEYGHHVVVGAGKTAIDAILFLLDGGVASDAITWIVPHDAWLWAREPVQPGIAMRCVLKMVEAAASHDTPDEVFADLEERGVVLRLDPTGTPTKWRCASVSRGEFAKLRGLANVVRKGRVRRLERGRITLDAGAHEVPQDALFIDCTANGLASAPTKPIFSDDAITLQSVFMCQQTFSASLIGRLAVADMTDAERNEILSPVPHPELTEHLASSLLASTQNMIRFSGRFPWWLRRNRLFLSHHEAPHHYLVGCVNMIRFHRRAIAAGRWEA
ncbi:MAG: hypothetical protein ACJ71Z_14270 [Aeromicrobium sp.]